MRITQMSKSGRWSLVLLFLVAACSSSTSSESDTADSETATTAFEPKPSIALVVNDWTTSAINVAIAEQLIERHLGYPVLPTRLDDTTEIYEGLADGALDAMIEVWPSNMSDRDQLYLDRDQVVDLGPLGSVGKIGWFVPRYVVEANPALAAWTGFDDPGVAAGFATAESGADGQFLGMNPDYRQFDQEIIDSLGLPFRVEFSGSEEESMVELQRRTEAQEPILLYWWTPTAAVAQFDLVNVALPDRTEACAEAMAAGFGRIDCDYPSDELFKVSSVTLATKAPDVARFLREFTLTTEDQMSLLVVVEREGQTIDAAAATWIAEHEPLWRAWLDS